MVGLLIVTHGDLAKSLITSAELIVGKTPLMESLGLYHGDDIDELMSKISSSVNQLHEQTGEGRVLILTDLFGGSPSNAAARCIHELKETIPLECVTGVSLPMLLEVATSREHVSLHELMQKCLEVGRTCAIDLRERLEL